MLYTQRKSQAILVSLIAMLAGATHLTINAMRNLGSAALSTRDSDVHITRTEGDCDFSKRITIKREPGANDPDAEHANQTTAADIFDDLFPPDSTQQTAIGAPPQPTSPSPSSVPTPPTPHAKPNSNLLSSQQQNALPDSSFIQQPTPQPLNQTVLQHLVAAIKQCRANPSASTDADTHATDEKQQYRCLVCNHLCTDASSLKEHMKNHPRKKQFSCTYCIQSTTHYRNSTLILHIQRHHPTQNAYFCWNIGCTASFPDSQQSRAHSKRCSFRIKTTSASHATHILHPYQCLAPGCGKSFSSDAQLKNHGYTHKEKKISCPVCPDALFQSASKWRAHTKSQKHQKNLQAAEGRNANNSQNTQGQQGGAFRPTAAKKRKVTHHDNHGGGGGAGGNDNE